MSNIIENRYEILFLYECKDCNPNGDPLDENRPRTDAETGQATITDVRIKRTIRDYLLAKNPDIEERLKKGMEILIRDTQKSDGFLSEGKDRAEQFLKSIEKEAKKGEKRYALQSAILKHCIDTRLFGCALPVGKGEGSIQVTGPVQFSAFNRSLHRVSPIMVQQTAAFAGNAKAEQKSFAERWLVPYALIASYAVINEVSAQTSQMTNNDLNELLEAIWQGTASLNTHSKVGHDPMLLVVAEYEPMQRLGALTTRISLMDKTKEETALRSTEDYKIDISKLLEGFKEFKALKSLKIRQDNRLQLKTNDQIGDFMSLAKQVGLPATEL
jgi:CRISPR-associated protein Csh2